jgi:hypothetical protein
MISIKTLKKPIKDVVPSIEFVKVENTKYKNIFIVLLILVKLR